MSPPLCNLCVFPQGYIKKDILGDDTCEHYELKDNFSQLAAYIQTDKDCYDILLAFPKLTRGLKRRVSDELRVVASSAGPKKMQKTGKGDTGSTDGLNLVPKGKGDSNKANKGKGNGKAKGVARRAAVSASAPSPGTGAFDEREGEVPDDATATRLVVARPDLVADEDLELVDGFGDEEQAAADE